MASNSFQTKDSCNCIPHHKSLGYVHKKHSNSDISNNKNNVINQTELIEKLFKVIQVLSDDINNLKKDVKDLKKENKVIKYKLSEFDVSCD